MYAGHRVLACLLLCVCISRLDFMPEFYVLDNQLLGVSCLCHLFELMYGLVVGVTCLL